MRSCTLYVHDINMRGFILCVCRCLTCGAAVLWWFVTVVGMVVVMVAILVDSAVVHAVTHVAVVVFSYHTE